MKCSFVIPSNTSLSNEIAIPEIDLDAFQYADEQETALLENYHNDEMIAMQKMTGLSEQVIDAELFRERISFDIKKFCFNFMKFLEKSTSYAVKIKSIDYFSVWLWLCAK